MSTANYLSFHLVSEPIRDPVTKFGGMPVWVDKPEWPISVRTGKPLLFIGQIALTPDVFGSVRGRMGYLFISEENPPLFGAQNADPESGENAVVIQPGINQHLLTRPNLSGPSLYRVEKGKRKLVFRETVQVLSEYSVAVVTREDPDEIDWDEDDPIANALHEMEDCKIGGTPIFIQDEHWPFADSKVLLLQLVSGKFPFHLNLGDAGTLYAFLSKDGVSGKLLWQCY